jgi:hypothetical protein
LPSTYATSLSRSPGTIPTTESLDIAPASHGCDVFHILPPPSPRRTCYTTRPHFMSGGGSPRSIFTPPNPDINKQPALKTQSPRRRSTPAYRKLSGAGKGLGPTSPQSQADSPPRLWTVNRTAQRGIVSTKASRSQPVQEIDFVHQPQSSNIPTAAGRKRLLPQPSPAVRDPPSQPLHKRRQLHSIHRYTVGALAFPSPPLFAASELVDGPKHPPLPADSPARASFFSNNQPPSPLFFSHSKRARPPLPPRFSSGEAGARMLSKAHAEESSIKTVTLARGSFSGSSPPAGFTGVTTAPSRSLSDRSSVTGPASPEVRHSCLNWAIQAR